MHLGEKARSQNALNFFDSTPSELFWLLLQERNTTANLKMYFLEGRGKTEEAKNSLLRPVDTIYTKGIKSNFNRKRTFSHHSKQDSGGFFLNWSLY